MYLQLCHTGLVLREKKAGELLQASIWENEVASRYSSTVGNQTIIKGRLNYVSRRSDLIG